MTFEREADADPGKTDHFWITIRAGDFGLLRISINTWSLKHVADGFDPRMRLGVVASRWSQFQRAAFFPRPG